MVRVEVLHPGHNGDEAFYENPARTLAIVQGRSGRWAVRLHGRVYEAGDGVLIAADPAALAAAFARLEGIHCILDESRRWRNTGGARMELITTG